MKQNVFKGRKISKRLMAKLQNGEYQKWIDYIKSDRTLRFEIRIGKVIIYFKKCKALEISSTNMTVDKNYFIDENDIINPNISTPKDYFNQIKTVINKWQKFKVNKEEFDSQQKIALANDINNRYFIIDM